MSTLVGDRQTLMKSSETLFGQLLEARAATQRYPAIQTRTKVLTYGRLYGLVESAAQQLSTLGVRSSDRVVLVLPNSVEYVVSILAVTSLGGLAVPVPVQVGTKRLAYILETTRPRLVLLLQDSALASLIPSVTLRVDLNSPTVTLSGHLMKKPASNDSEPKVGRDSAAVVLFSSGSSGRAKGVVLKHKHLLRTARTLSTVFGLERDHRELLICPMCHSDGWQRVATTLLAGGCVVIPQGQLSIPGMLEDIKRYRITGFYTPPPLIRYLLMAQASKVRQATTSCRSIEIGSAPLTAAEIRQLAHAVPTARIFVHYGLTECSRAVILDCQAHPSKLHTVGTASPGVDVAICDKDGARLGSNQEGLILLRGFQQSDSYWNRPDLNEQQFRDGWLVTGDYGSLDPDGFLSFLGRRDEMITSAGYHFFPTEIEAELGTVDGVAQYLVAGVSDPHGILEQVPWAFVVPRDPRCWKPGDFMSRARTHLPAHMVPHRVKVVPSLPLTASGKPDRRQTVKLYAHTN